MLTLTALGMLALAIAAHLSGRRPLGGQGTLARMLESRAVLALIFATTFLVLWYTWAALSPIPVVHDEMAYVLQAQIYARGHWSLPSPPLPLFWEQPHVLTEPRLAAKYFPGHPLLMSLGAMIGWVALMPLVLQATSGVLLFALARRLTNGGVAFAAWVLWLLSPMVLYFGASYYSEATTTVCWLAGWYALLEWAGTRRLQWLLLVAFFTGWDAITRPLTGVAYAIPIAFVVLPIVVRERRWRDLAFAMLVGTAVMAIIPLWSWRTTGAFTVTPLSLYTRMYMPYDVPGFGLKTIPPLHSITPDLAAWNQIYQSSHIHHFPSTLLAELLERSRFLAVSVWGATNNILAVFALLGLATLNRRSAFAVGSALVLLVTYLAFATPANWTLYYYESVPAYAFLTACGMAWAASLIGRPFRAGASADMSWTSPRWCHALITAALCFAVPGVMTLRVIRHQHVTDRRFLAPFYQLLGSIHDERAILFVHHAGNHNPHVAFVRNTADLSAERIWVVYDRGDEENRRLIALAPGRKTFLFDEAQRKMYRYDPTQSP